MLDFQYSLRTDVIFGKDMITRLPEVLEEYGKKVLLVYGGKSIHRTGLYNVIMDQLKNFEVYELSGIQPNPKIDSVNEGCKICKEKGIEVILAVGGGSVLDASKAIGIGANYNGDCWDLITQKSPITDCLPLVGVLTVAASGSEVGNGAVISNPATNQKIGIDYKDMIYRHIIMDPTYTMTLPKYQSACGAIDIFSHLIEQYFTGEYTLLSKGLCEAVMKTIIEYAPVIIQHPDNYEARAQIMWSASLANNGILSNGSSYSGWPCHAIEHELSAYYDITHGHGLAIVLPAWMEYVLNDTTVDQFARYARKVWDIQEEEDYKAARMGIQSTKKFFEDLGISTTLSSVNIPDDLFDQIAKEAQINGYLDYAFVPLTKEDVVTILNSCK